MLRPITIEQMVAHASLELRLVAGATGRTRGVDVPRIQKPGLALTGWPEQLHERRALVLGGTEIEFLESADASARALGIATMLAANPACIVISRGLTAPEDLVTACEAREVALLSSSLVTSELIVKLTGWLNDRLAPSTELHGVMLDVLGIGVMLSGKSGIGKSETALDLVMRGHRFVADDVVVVRRKGDALFGSSARIISYHMEIRGLGIINIKDLFGVSAVRDNKKLELVVEMVEWRDDEEYDRLGIDDDRIEILEVAVPRVRLPVRPGRNLATIVEVGARNQLLKLGGHHSARAFQAELDLALGNRRDVDLDAVE
ncbi:MAG: HPr(Ser) kinase/phosphatase [Kofleriaceae bacterium]